MTTDTHTPTHTHTHAHTHAHTSPSFAPSLPLITVAPVMMVNLSRTAICDPAKQSESGACLETLPYESGSVCLHLPVVSSIGDFCFVFQSSLEAVHQPHLLDVYLESCAPSSPVECCVTLQICTTAPPSPCAHWFTFYVAAAAAAVAAKPKLRPRMLRQPIPLRCR